MMKIGMTFFSKIAEKRMKNPKNGFEKGKNL
jgi:hypothetical protein